MTTITRSPGLPTGHMGLLCGSGQRGITAEHDAIVDRAARALAQAYARDVTIRFNSDRQMGGAWIVTDRVDSIGANAEIGITAAYHRLAEMKAVFERWGETDKFEDELRDVFGIDLSNAPADWITLAVKIGPRALKRPSLANCMTDDPARAHAYRRVDSIETALVIIARDAVVPDLR